MNDENTAPNTETGSGGSSGAAESCAQADDEYAALDARAKIAGDLYRGGQISRVECFRLEMDAALGEDSGPINYDTEPLPDDPRVGKPVESMPE